MTQLFRESELSCGFYHWDDSKLIKKAGEFLRSHPELGTFTSYEIHAFALIVYPTKGIMESKCKGKEGLPTSDLISRKLGPEGIKIYRDVFKNNSINLRNKFFGQGLIPKLWPLFKDL